MNSFCKYRFELADGSVWIFTATERVSAWLHELAGIMGLRPGGDNWTHKISFSGAGDFDSLESPEEIRGGRADDNGWHLFRQGAIYRLWRHETIPEVYMELNEEFVEHAEIRYINMWSALRELYRHALATGGTPIHAALAEIDGRGVLIAGAAETGKSTCYRRLPGYWNALCDDQALVMRDGKGDYMVHPLPTWSDHLWQELKKSWNVERAVPLSAIFFLDQSSLDEAVPLSDPAKAVLMIFDAAKQVWEPVWERIESNEKREQSSTLFRNASEMAGVIPTYRLRATLDGEFWKEMERVTH